jgi:hypothetical protein
MLTHGAGLERVHPQPGQAERGSPFAARVAPHNQARLFEHLDCFVDRALIRICEGVRP